MKKRKGFTLVELIISLLVMSITYAAMSMSSAAAKQTAEHEAERLAAYIYRLMDKADMLHNNFYIVTDPGYILVNWDSGPDDLSFKATQGCRYEMEGKLTYNSRKRRFNNGGTITVKDSQDGVYYVIIAGITEGRIRISPTNNPSGSEIPSASE